MPEEATLSTLNVQNRGRLGR